MMTQPKMETMMPPQPVQQPRSRRGWLIALIILLVIIIGGLLFWHFSHKKQLTPAQTLQELKSSSEPVTASPADRAQALSDAQKNSRQNAVSEQQQLNILNNLGK